jgi:beta-glucanase (GH16 family)
MKCNAMDRTNTYLTAVLLLLAAGRIATAQANGPASSAPQALLDFMSAKAEESLRPSSEQVTVAPSGDPAAPGLVVTIRPGKEDYPGVGLQPQGTAAWDLSAFGHVEARLANMGEKTISITLRVDNAGDWRDNPWNAETISLKPGASGTVTTVFGYSYGRHPAYALQPAAVVNVLLFAGKSDAVQSFRIESVVAAGPAGEKPPVDPRSVRVKPEGGVLLGPGVAVAADKQIEAKGAEVIVLAEGDRPSLRISFATPEAEQTVRFEPAIGRWDLRDCLEIRVKLSNAGPVPATPRVRVESDGGMTDWVSTAAPVPPGATQEVTVSFVNPVPWRGIKKSGDRTSWEGEPGTGNQVTNDAVGAVSLSASRPMGGAALVVESIRAGLPPAPVLPDWLGQRPPVEGDWVKTFDEDFSGTTIDLSKWNNAGPNYWDKTSHWSRNNVIVGGGVARLRYEKETGPQNDDPKEKSSAYASGYLDTYGKWVQRYGYFEARMKLPAAPGLWPAFWMVPDRGEGAGPQWVRQDTANGGMESDIMEHLTRWGPCRYNIAMHWDGYGKEHKALGSSLVYVQPDKEGFITAGLLWTPGLLVYYGNGREVAQWEDPRVASVQADMMFTLPMGGWDNNCLDDTQLPADFVIDYVRAWQRKDLIRP